jgi:hypothetical protein
MLYTHQVGKKVFFWESTVAQPNWKNGRSGMLTSLVLENGVWVATVETNEGSQKFFQNGDSWVLTPA